MAEQQSGLLSSSRRYRLFQGRYVLVFLAAALATLGLAFWTTHQYTTRETSLVVPAVLVLIALTIVGLWLSYRLRQQKYVNAQSSALQETQRRLQRQQQAWRHLRELHQQNISEEHFLQAVQVSLRELLEISRTSIWYFNDPAGTATCRASLDLSLVNAQGDMQSLSAYIDTLNRVPFIESNHAQQSPRLSIMRQYLAEHDVASAIDVGIFVGGELRGSLCCESHQIRLWQPDEVNAIMAISGLLSQFAESLRRRAAENDLYHQIHYDAVTGLPTLHDIAESIAQAPSRLNAFHLIIIRVRGLNHINQLLGQGGGDEALRQVASEIDRRLLSRRRTPRLARLPVNQFAILLPGNPRDTWLQQRLDDLLATLTEMNWTIHEQPFQLHFAAGMAHYPQDGDHFEQVLQCAELALKQARHEGLSSLVQYAPQLSEWESRQLRTERELRVAIAEQQFRIYLQPQYDLEGEMRGAEVLLRWQHPQRGLIEPGDFIEDAERSGLIRPMGYWVLEQAVDLLRGPLAAGEITLAVNVSIDQLRDEGFIARVEALIERGGFAPRRLILEIVESLLATPGMTTTLQLLRRLGVQLALDDFGTGYSSLRYLQDFPVDEIKLDKTFLVPLQRETDAPLARSIIGLAKTLHLRLVAEGIEIPSQLEFLRQQRVDLLQGFLLARPEPVERFLLRLAERA